MRRVVPILIALLALGAAPTDALGKPAPPPRVALTHLREGTEVEALAVGADGYLWFAGANRGATPSNVVGRISPGGAVDEYTVPGTASVLGIGDLTRGPEGDMWFTEPAANRIERVAPTGNPEGFTVPTPGSLPTGIVQAPGGFLWVTMEGTGKVAQVDPAGSAAELTLAPCARPAAIALGPDGALWAVETETATLARISLQGTSASYPLPTNGEIFKGAINSDIATGPDGNLWLSQSDGPFIGEVIPTQAQPEYVRHEVPVEGGGTTLITKGPREDLWFATTGGEIGSIGTRGGEVGDPGCPLAACAGPITALAEGPEGKLWFAAGETLGTYSPAPLFLVKTGPVKLTGRNLKLPLECRGGAAGERCQGTIEAVRGKTPIVRGHFTIATMTRHKVSMHFVGAPGRRAARKRHPRMHYVARFKSKRVPIYEAH